VCVGINNFSFVLFLHKLQYKHIGDRVHWMILHLHYSDMVRDYCSWRDSILGREEFTAARFAGVGTDTWWDNGIGRCDCQYSD